MPDEELPANVDATLNDALGDDAPPKKGARGKPKPSYQVIGDSRIHVSKAAGKVWKSRVAIAMKHTEEIRDAWTEAIRYYGNDQTKKRTGSDASENIGRDPRLSSEINEVENVVFANITTMVPALYARNPECEFTTENPEYKPLATTLERLVNVIGGKAVTPGINLKPKAKRCVVTTLLTNRSWMKIGWTIKSESSEQALIDLQVLSDQLTKTKTPKEIVEIEGKLQALEESIDMLSPAGPFAKVKSPFKILVDPSAEEIDLSDARWVIEEDMLSVEYVMARYGTKKKGDKEYKSLYQPTHVLKASIAEGEHDTDNSENYSIFEDNEEMTAKNFGFDDEVSFNKAKMMKVYIVWDKITRRVLMYNSKDWTWPIWVWDDPLQLDRFFPFYPLTFFESPAGPLTKGEVSYYLDQQDAINAITDERSKARHWARRNIVFNSSLMDENDAAELLNGPDGTAKGIKLPPDTKFSDLIGSVPVPSLAFDELFDKEGLYRAIDRISSVSTVMRGEQFKTNTNQRAVQANVGASNMRVDEKADQIEDWIGDIYWGIAQLCLQHMKQETVVYLVGQERGADWQNLTAQEIGEYCFSVVGGSTKKPTSQAKKEEALEMAQVLGQFVNAAPGPVISTMLTVMEAAFDEVTISEEMWAELREAITAGQQGQGGAPQEQGAPPVDAKTASPEQLKELLASLPPEIKQQVQSAIQSGVSPQDALQQAITQAQAQQQQQPAPQQAPQPAIQ